MAPRQFSTALAVLSIPAIAIALAGCAPEPDSSPQADSADSPAQRATPEPSSGGPSEQEPAASEFDAGAHSLDDPASIWVVTNKMRPLQPIDFAPDDLVMPAGVENEFAQPLREPAARAVESLVASAAAAGVDVRIISAYRDHATQIALYDGYVSRDGSDAADTYSARPGHSEHQTGLVVDFDDHGECYLAACFGDTPSGVWLAEHAAEHGFIIRYPDGKQDVTGFVPEPWHFRYVGTELAAEMRESGVTTLEEFFDLPSAPGYAL